MKKLLMIMNLIGIIFLLCAWSPLAGGGNHCDTYYEDGVNDALQAIMLLDLELDLKGTPRPWGEMADIVRDRLGVETE